ncbi:MAG: aspartate/glutamate racemase family protein [Candidatus Accumulibacter sp.]|nr:aspartate/glutamate racemase family protein [Accumulibacter sp.]
MKTIGLIGGMSWQSTALYYRQINETAQRRLGALHSAKILLYSVDFQEVEALQRAGDWHAAGAYLAEAAKRLAAGGADFLLLASNTMHKVAPAIEAATPLPLLHIADPTATAIRRAGLTTVGLLGTRFTLEEEFYRQRLSDQHGLRVLLPGPAERERMHRVIYDELCQGQFTEASRAEFRQMIARLVSAGAEGIILGCTEITLLVDESDAAVPLFDTTSLHAIAAVDRAIGVSPARIGHPGDLETR